MEKTYFRRDYRFLHSIVKEVYTDIPAGLIPAGHQRDLRRYAGVFDAMDLGLKESYCFLSIRTPGEEPAVYLCRTARKQQNVVSEGNYVQAIGWKQTGDSPLLEHYEEILGTRFYTEAEIDAFAEQGSAPNEEHTPAPRPIQPVPADREAIRAVLYGAMLRWQQGTAQVHIAVPEAEMGRYNDYVLGAMRTIWSYFPAYMRAAVGFTSYLQPRRERDFPKFTILFVPYSMADVNTIRLDGSSPNAYSAMIRSTGIQQLDAVLDTLASLDDPEERRSFLRGIYDDMEREANLAERSFSPMNYVKWGRGLELLRAEGSVARLLPEWVAYSRSRDSYPPAIRRKIEAMIDRRLTAPELSRALEAELRGGRPSLTALDKTVEQYWPLCQERDSCKEALWIFLRDNLEKTGQSEEKICTALRERKESWSRLTDKKSYGECQVSWGLRAAEAKRARTEQKLREVTVTAANTRSVDAAALHSQLQEQRARFREETRPFVDEVTLREMDAGLEQKERSYVLALLCQELERECSLRPEGHRAIQAEQEKLKKLQDLLPEEKNAEELQFLGKLRARQSELNELLQDTRTLSADLQEKIRGSEGYFQALEAAAAQAERLSPEDRTRLLRTLDQMRPTERSAYYAAFRRACGEDLSIRALRARKGFFRSRVEEDLLRLQEGPQRLDMRDPSAASLARQIQTLRRERELIGADRTFQVILGRDTLDAALVEKTAALRPLEEKAGSPEELERTGLTLLRLGAFAPEQLGSLAELFSSAEIGLGRLLEAALRGDAGEMNRQQFYELFRKILTIRKEKYGKTTEEILRWISEKLQITQAGPEADAAFRQLAREAGGRGNGAKRKTGLIVALAGLALLAVAAVLLIFVFDVFHKAQEEEPAPEYLARIEQSYQSGEGQTGGVFDLSCRELGNESVDEILRYYRAGDLLAQGRDTEELLADPQVLELLGYRTALDLSGNPDLSDVSALLQLGGLRRLYLDEDPLLTQLPGVEDLRFLELLSLRGTGIDADQIEALSRALPECVVLWREDGKDCLILDGVRYSAGEPALDLRGRGASLLRVMTEPRVAATLGQVQELHLGGAPLETLRGLQQLKDLLYLDLSAAGMSGELLPQLYDIESLRLLDLSHNDELYQSDLAQLQARLGNCLILCQPAEEDLNALRSVQLSGMSYPVNSRELDLSGLKLTEEELGLLEEFPLLTSLDLSDTGISDLSFLRELTGLERLDIRNNSVTDLSPLVGLENLELLLADGNPLEKLGAGEKDPMPALKTLSLSSFSPELDLSALRWMPNLTVLDLGDYREDPEAPLAETLLELENLKILKLRSPDQLTAETRQLLAERCAIITTAPGESFLLPTQPEPLDEADAEQENPEGESPAEENKAEEEEGDDGSGENAETGP